MLYKKLEYVFYMFYIFFVYVFKKFTIFIMLENILVKAEISRNQVD